LQFMKSLHIAKHIGGGGFYEDTGSKIRGYLRSYSRKTRNDS
jgi:hypothetical protein